MFAGDDSIVYIIHFYTASSGKNLITGWAKFNGANAICFVVVKHF